MFIIILEEYNGDDIGSNITIIDSLIDKISEYNLISCNNINDINNNEFIVSNLLFNSSIISKTILNKYLSELN